MLAEAPINDRVRCVHPPHSLSIRTHAPYTPNIYALHPSHVRPTPPHKRPSPLTRALHPSHIRTHSTCICNYRPHTYIPLVAWQLCRSTCSRPAALNTATTARAVQRSHIRRAALHTATTGHAVQHNAHISAAPTLSPTLSRTPRALLPPFPRHAHRHDRWRQPSATSNTACAPPRCFIPGTNSTSGHCCTRRFWPRNPDRSSCASSAPGSSGLRT